MKARILNGCFILVLLTALFSVTFGLGRSYSDVTITGIIRQDQDCKVKDVAFSCPEDFIPAQTGPDENAVMLRHKKYKLGIFVAVAPSNLDEKSFTQSLARAIAQELFPQEPQNYSWKHLDAKGKISKYEVKAGEIQGFNKSLRLMVQYHHLVVGNKQLILGYGFELGRGKEAERLFDKGLGGDSMPGCYALVEILTSITGEKFESDNSPCMIVAAPPPERRKP